MGFVVFPNILVFTRAYSFIISKILIFYLYHFSINTATTNLGLQHCCNYTVVINSNNSYNSEVNFINNY